MTNPPKCVTLLAVVGLSACQPPAAPSPDNMYHEKILAPGVTLPMTLSESYQAAFEAAPQLTALRFLDAYDDFAASGPVTRARVEGHASLRAGMERGQFLGHILAMDLDGDAQITRLELDAALALPGWANKPPAIEQIFGSDDNQDGRISIDEALRFSDTLRAKSAAKILKPIESYFLMSDANGDEIVTRVEMKNYLYEKLDKHNALPPQLRGGGDGALP